MDACEVVRLFVNKVMVPAESRRHENPGYGRLKALRALVYFRLKGFENDTWIVKHLKGHRRVVRVSGLPTCLTGRPLGGVEVSLQPAGGGLRPTRKPPPAPSAGQLIADSTPPVEIHDPEAERGLARRGLSRGSSSMRLSTSLGLL